MRVERQDVVFLDGCVFVMVSRERRSRFDTLYKILEVCKPGAKKTQIILRANLNHQLVSKFLDELVRTGLLKIDGNEYIITEKGLRYVEKFDDLRKTLGEQV